MASYKTKCIYCESRNVSETRGAEDDVYETITIHCNNCGESYKLLYDNNNDGYEMVED